MAKELASFNIRCNSISPGLTDTDLMKESTKQEFIDKTIRKFNDKKDCTNQKRLLM